MKAEEKEKRFYEIHEPPTVGKEFLLELEKTDEFVFHGTDIDVPALEPRQAVDVETGPDGIPAIFASSKVDFATFHAIINKKNCPVADPAVSGATTNDAGESELHFGATETTLNQLKPESDGWVYVFNKADFLQRDGQGVEYVTDKPLQPIHKIRVTRADLPHNIEIL